MNLSLIEYSACSHLRARSGWAGLAYSIYPREGRQFRCEGTKLICFSLILADGDAVPTLR